MRELVGQGKPFYSGLDKAAGLLRRKVGTGSEFLKELMSIPGVKQAEIAERGLGELLNAPKMTHEQFMAALGEKPAPAIGEKVFANKLLKNPGSDPDPHHEQWTLPGGDNYREMLIKAPAPKYSQDKIMEVEAKLRRAAPNMVKHYTDMLNVMKKDAGQNEQFPGVSAHFGGEPGILASMRLKDRMVDQPAEIRHVAFNNNSGHPTPDFATPEELDAYIKTLPANIQSSLVKKQAQIAKPPLKLLHLEELQSDWHQQGREKGYKSQKTLIDYDDPEYKAARRKTMDLQNEFNSNNANPEKQEEIEPLLRQAELEERKFIDLRNAYNDAIPNAPFKKNWEEMALKRLIHHAAEKGYHGVVVTPGAEQADRYNLAKHIDSIMLVPNPQSNKETHPYYFKAFDKRGNRVANDAVDEAGLQEYIGKEPAKQLLSSPANPLGERMISGANIVTGGEGMKGFYDKKVPNILNSIGKKYGVKTELGGHTIQGRGKERTEEEFRQALMDAGHRTNPLTLAQQRELDYEPKPTPLHYFPITEEMRQDVKKNGIPLYKSGGIVSTH